MNLINRWWIITWISVLGGTTSKSLPTIPAVTVVPVASVWARPNPPELGKYQTAPAKILNPLPLRSVHILNQRTQLLYGEHVNLLQDPPCDGWVKIQAIEQLRFSRLQQQWYPIEGWVRANVLRELYEPKPPTMLVTSLWATVYDSPSTISAIHMHLPLGTVLRGTSTSDIKDWVAVDLYGIGTKFIRATEVRNLSKVVAPDDIAKLRDSVVDWARKFALAAFPYLWNGRSPFNGEQFDDIIALVGPAASTNCSGLPNLIYRACGLTIPRGCQDQFLASTPVAMTEVQPGDLIFIGKTNAYGHVWMHHVLIFLCNDNHDNSWVVESTGHDCVKKKCVRAVTLRGAGFNIKNLAQVKAGDVVQRLDQTVKIYAGTFLTHTQAQQRRTDLVMAGQRPSAVTL